MNSNDRVPPSDELESKRKQAELEKLELEIRSLKAGMGWKATLLKLLPLVTAIVAVAGFLGGVRQNNVAREKEFKRHFWELQLKYYVDASHLAAQLATLPEGEERQVAHQRFQELYHGDLVVFEDDKVMRAMRDFTQNYIDYLEDPGLQVQLQKSARDLARTCRESAARQWDIELRKLDVARY